jgi:anti-sigma-K factor RskA
MTVDPQDRADLYVLGALEADEAAAVARDMATDPALAAAVAAARARFAPIDDTADPVEPSPALWPRIEAAIDADGGARRTRPAAPRPLADWRSRAQNWRAGAISALAASVVLAAALGWRVLVVETPAVVAVLMDAESRPVAIVEDFGDGPARVTPLVSVAAPEGRAFQVWTKFSEEVGPVSLGVLDRLSADTVGAAGLPPPVDGQLYEITIEQAGGSPTGKPTGPIVGLGFGRPPR